MIYADAIAGLFAFSLFIVFFYGPWQQTVTDVARQVVFEQRDAVFDMASAGTMDFDSDEYKSVRKSFNQFIRFAHDLTWVRFVALYPVGDSEPSAVSKALGKIENQETRKQVARHLRRARLAIMTMMVFKSLPLLIASAIVAIVALCVGSLREIIVKIDSAFGERIQAEAESA